MTPRLSTLTPEEYDRLHAPFRCGPKFVELKGRPEGHKEVDMDELRKRQEGKCGDGCRFDPAPRPDVSTTWPPLKYFEPAEFACKCCGEVRMDREFLLLLDRARLIAETPFRITSGYRCPKHDQEVNGAGNHPQGRAADIAVSGSEERYAVLRALSVCKFPRIGIAKSFIHVDTCEDKPRPVVWIY